MVETVSIESIDENVREYALELIAAGFTVYGHVSPVSGLMRWFHYSIPDENGVPRYGTYSDGHDLNFGIPSHSMPIRPSREYGSCMSFSEALANQPTVEAARRCARPQNWGVWLNTTLPNAEPWGIGTSYLPVEVEQEGDDDDE